MPPPSEEQLPRATVMARRLVAARLRPGGRALDGTAGNGRDTLFLAECVGPEGAVAGFDVQERALAETRRRVAAHPQVALHLAGHERLAEYVDGPLHAAMFNLGYLPSGDRSLTTLPATTLAALETAAGLLAPGGLLTVVCYPRHPGGAEETAAVAAWAAALDPEGFAAADYGFLNRRNAPPRLVAVERLGTNSR